MTKTTTYLDLSPLSAYQLQQIPVLCDEFSVPILVKYREQFEQGKYIENMPFLLYIDRFGCFTCSFVRHYEKTEIQLSEFREVLSDTFANEDSEAKSIEEKADAILNLLNGYNLTDDQKLQILSTTRKRLEKVK